MKFKCRQYLQLPHFAALQLAQRLQRRFFLANVEYTHISSQHIYSRIK